MRDYDPATARWTGVDPVTHFSQSPYNAFDGNPVLFSDPSGSDSIIYGMAGQTANANQWNRGHSSFGNASYSSGGLHFYGSAKSQFEQSYAGHLARQTTSFTRSVIGTFVAGALKQIQNVENAKITYQKFEIANDKSTFAYMVNNTMSTGNEISALLTDTATFVFESDQNTSISAEMNFGLIKNDNPNNYLAIVHTHTDGPDLSPQDRGLSEKYQIPNFTLDIQSGYIGHGYDNLNGHSFDTDRTIYKNNGTSIRADINSLLNGQFNIRNYAIDILQKVGLY